MAEILANIWFLSGILWTKKVVLYVVFLFFQVIKVSLFSLREIFFFFEYTNNSCKYGFWPKSGLTLNSTDCWFHDSGCIKKNSSTTCWNYRHYFTISQSWLILHNFDNLVICITVVNQLVHVLTLNSPSIFFLKLGVQLPSSMLLLRA